MATLLTPNYAVYLYICAYVCAYMCMCVCIQVCMFKNGAGQNKMLYSADIIAFSINIFFKSIERDFFSNPLKGINYFSFIIHEILKLVILNSKMHFFFPEERSLNYQLLKVHRSIESPDMEAYLRIFRPTFHVRHVLCL